MRSQVPTLHCDSEDVCDEWAVDNYETCASTVGGVRITTTTRARAGSALRTTTTAPSTPTRQAMTDARLAAAVEAAARAEFYEDAWEDGITWESISQADRDSWIHEVWVNRIEAALAAADAWDRERSAPIAGCWCVTCATQSLGLSPWSSTMIRGMVTCPDCGNKRCPKATHHDNACTGSNEPGQEGSVYGPPPDEPREPRPVPL